MTLTELEIKVLELDPYDYVKSDLDGFDAYAYFDLPEELDEQVRKLTDKECELFHSFLDDYIERLSTMGLKPTQEYMRANLD